MPYWIATGGSDHAIQLWDLRYPGIPFLHINAHYDAINSVHQNAISLFFNLPSFHGHYRMPIYYVPGRRIGRCVYGI
jgi:hypothetical protein